MALIIFTGEHEAVPLKALHGDNVKQLDEIVDGICQRNGGFAELVLDLIQGVVVKFCINKESYKGRKVKVLKEKESA